MFDGRCQTYNRRSSQLQRQLPAAVVSLRFLLRRLLSEADRAPHGAELHHYAAALARLYALASQSDVVRF